MQHIILFGLPGAGKSFTGRILEDAYGYMYIDGDQYLPEEMKEALQNNLPVTDVWRDAFMERIREVFNTLSKKHKFLVLTQTFLKDRHRIVFKEIFPQSEFILVKADNSIRKQRFMTQNVFTFNDTYWESMQNNFEPISIEFSEIENNKDGKNHLLRQLNQLLNKKSII